MEIALERIKHWGLKGGLGILDQGLYSGVNFLLGILLARWVSPEMYGGYSASFSVFLLLSTFQVALIAEPMSIFGANKYSENITSYLNYLLRIQWIGAILGAIFLILFAFFFASGVLRESTIAMAVSLPCILLFWYLRRAFYLEMHSDLALVSSSIYSTLVILIIILVQYFGFLTSSIAYFAMALSSLFASFYALKKLHMKFFGENINSFKLKPEKVNREIWDFGKWVLPAYLTGWLTSLSFPFIISIFLNAQYAGAFRAVQNLYLPFQQFLAAITLLILPWLAKKNMDYGSNRLLALTRVAAVIIGVMALIYCLLIVLFRHELLAMLYQNWFYSLFDDLVIYLAISTVLGSAPLILGLALRIMDKPNNIFWSKGCAAIFTLLIGLPLIWIYGMNGVIVALTGGAAIEAVVLLIFFIRIQNFRSILYQP